MEHWSVCLYKISWTATGKVRTDSPFSFSAVLSPVSKRQLCIARYCQSVRPSACLSVCVIFIPVRCYASAGISCHRVSVCPFVCLCLIFRTVLQRMCSALLLTRDLFATATFVVIHFSSFTLKHFVS